MSDELDPEVEAAAVLDLMRQADGLLVEAQERARVAALVDDDVSWANRIGFVRRLLSRGVADLSGIEPPPDPLDPRPVEVVTSPLLNGDHDPGPTEP